MPDDSKINEHADAIVRGHKPDWLKIQLAVNQNYKQIKHTLHSHKLHSVCEEARCPNIHECFSRFKTATLMLLGDICTRHCLFCSVKKGQPFMDEFQETERVVQWVKELALQHLVITMVSRDDLQDGGASGLAAVVEALHRQVPDCSVEILCSDLKGDYQAVTRVVQSRPAIFAHNLETVRRLSPVIRPEADYERSLQVLKWAKDLMTHDKTATGETTGETTGYIKSGLMLGLGETKAEILVAMEDLKAHGVDILVLGQYLQPGKEQLPVQKYWHPDEFKALKETAQALGFCYCEAGPLVRSSFHSREQLDYLRG